MPDGISRLRVTVSAEPRGGKGPGLTLSGKGEGTPRLLKPGPTVAEWLARAAPGVEPETGVMAIEAVREAREAALASTVMAGGLNVAVERTRALVAVDLDFAGVPGRDGGKVKDIARLSIIINSDETARIQEAHMFIGHWLCEAMDEVVLSGGLD